MKPFPNWEMKLAKGKFVLRNQGIIKCAACGDTGGYSVSYATSRSNPAQCMLYDALAPNKAHRGILELPCSVCKIDLILNLLLVMLIAEKYRLDTVKGLCYNIDSVEVCLGNFLCIKQPNNWSCLLAAFCAITHTPFADAVRRIGHDGDFPIGKGNLRRGFDIQEIIEAFVGRYSITEITVAVPYLEGVGDLPSPTLGTDANERIRRYLRRYRGVVHLSQGGDRDHAMAWDGQFLFDTTHRKFVVLNDSMKFDTFWIVERRNAKIALENSNG